jgi:hypothetical protein
MANALYDAGRSHFLDGDIDWSADNIKVVCVDHGVDTPNVSTDDFLDDIGAGARIATSGNLASKTSTAGVADAADLTITSVTGASFESINLYDDTPVAESGKFLIAYIDTATGLPCTPNGGDITIQWDNSPTSKIFKL